MSEFDAIVVGGGFAGLSAACALAERGARVLLLEARAALGGRASSFIDPSTRERIDNGQHVLFGCYRETFRFLRRIGAESNVSVQRGLDVGVIERDRTRSRLACPSLPAPWHLLAGVLEWEALGWRDQVAILHLLGPLRDARAQLRGRTTRAAASPDETVEQWLHRNGQTAPLVELLWQPLALAALNQPIDRAAALPFTRVLAEMFGDDPAAAAVALPVLPLDEMYAEPSRMYLESRRGVVRTGAPARLSAGRDGSLRVMVRNEVLTADVIVCAVPWFDLPMMLADVGGLASVVEAAARTTASPIVTVNLWFDRRLLDRPFVGLPGRLMQWAFEKPVWPTPGERAVSWNDGSRLSLVSSGAEAVVGWSNQHLIDHALEEVSDALPEVRAATLHRATVVRERRATFSLAPGQPARPGIRTALRGLLLAGDWIDTGLPATIESAVRSGHMAAELAEREFGN